MARVIVETFIHAPIERCFNLARDVDVHCRTTMRTRERAVAGVKTGMLGLGDTITFQAVHFGIRQRLTARIVEFYPPNLFVDEMQQGAFASMRHTHSFTAVDGGTLMRDTLDFISPLGILGRLADCLFLVSYMRRFLETRNAALKAIAEAPQINY